MNKKNLRFIIALSVEAKSIIELYKLKEINLPPNIFKIYKNIDLNIWLIISGIGNVNSAAATIYLYKSSPKNKKNIWINVGMAGSKNFDVGSIFNIKKVSYKNTLKEESFYLSTLVNTKIPINEIVSVDALEKNLNEIKSIYEMEGYGFIKTVERFCSRELIIIIKIISDNEKIPPINFIKTTKHFMKSNIKALEELINDYIKISSSIKNKRKYNINIINKKFHITYSSKVIIEDLAFKFEKIYSRKELEIILSEAKTLKDFIREVKKKINSYVLKI